MDLIITEFYAKRPGLIFFSSAHRTCSRTDIMLDHETSFNKFKKTEITSGIFSDYNGTNQKSITRKTGKNTNMWKMNMLITKQPMDH